ncbi:MAG: hypothetical protein ACSHYB_09825 [Roseibacillus sp.]
MADEKWTKEKVGGEEFRLLNLDHSSVEKRVLAEMEAGIDVYYDRRWGATAVLTDWLGAHREVFENKKVLALGVGVGEESLLLGKFAEHIWLNDLAPVSLELCAEQMEENGLPDFTLLVGRYEQLDLPQVDLVVGGFLIYNDETCAAMEAFLKEYQGQVILVNERLAPFPEFLKRHKHEIIFDDDSGAVGVLLTCS